MIPKRNGLMANIKIGLESTRRASTTVLLSYSLENVWLIMLTAPSARGTALNLVSRRLPRLIAGKGMPSIGCVNDSETHGQ